MLPKTNLFKDKLFTFTSRGGRGIKESNIDSEFFLSLPKKFQHSHVKFHYNTRFWIFDSFRFLFLIKNTKNVNLVLVQYIRNLHVFPSYKLLNHIKSNNVEILKIWLDTWNENLWHKRILPVSNLSSRNILIDVPSNILSKLDKSGEYSWSPIPVSSYPYKKMENRENFVFYSGATARSGLYKERSEYISFLKEADISIFGNAYDWNNPSRRPSYDLYRKALSDSKIALNFTWKGDVDVTTGRTWEIFSSGVLLLQNKSKILGNFFEPGVHFLEFDSKEKCAELLHELSRDMAKIARIAKSGMDQYNSLFSSTKFWQKQLTDRHNIL
jgi:hypothetical protein